MSVRNRFTIENIYGFTCSLRTLLVHAIHDAIVMEVEVKDLEDRKWHQNEFNDIEDC